MFYNIIIIKNNSLIELDVYDKLLTRAFHKLCDKEKIKENPKKHGQYWLPECWENRIEHWKQIVTIQEKEITQKDDSMFFAKTFLHAIKFCQSDEDWERLYSFYRKMRDNEIVYYENQEKYYREHYDEIMKDEKKFHDEIMKEIKKAKKQVKAEKK